MKLKDLIKQYGEYEVPDELIAQFKKPKKKTAWDLENGTTYFGIFGDGSIDERTYGKSIIDTRYIEIGNAFLTKEEAEQDVERRMVETLLLKCGGRRWFRKIPKTISKNYYIWLSEAKYIIISDTNPVLGAIYFDTKEQAEKAIAEIGEERIKNALFKVR